MNALHFRLAILDPIAHNLVILVRIGGDMRKKWQVQEAKARFSELLRSAASDPQTITVHGRPAAVVVAADEYDRLSEKRGKPTLTEFLRDSPLAGVELDLERDRSLPRNTGL